MFQCGWYRILITPVSIRIGQTGDILQIGWLSIPQQFVFFFFFLDFFFNRKERDSFRDQNTKFPLSIMGGHKITHSTVSAPLRLGAFFSNSEMCLTLSPHCVSGVGFTTAFLSLFLVLYSEL